MSVNLISKSLSAEMHAEARDLLERAVELDPLSSDAHALLANVYLGEHRFDMNPRPNPIGRAMLRALAATQLDPQNAYARCWLAIVHFFRGENDRFEEEARRALALNPNDPETLAGVGHYLAFMGEFERGAELSRRAQQLNPLYPSWYNFSFARLHYHQKRYEDAVVDVQHAGLPHFYWTHLLTAAALGQLGRAEAGAARAHIFELSGMRHRMISNISCRVCGKLAYEHQISLNLTCRRVIGEGSSSHNSLPTKYWLDIIDLRGEGEPHLARILEISDLLAGRLAKSTNSDRVCRIQSLVALSVGLTQRFCKPRHDPFHLLARLLIDRISLLGESRDGETDCQHRHDQQ
jgi:cytochrome c-type biogenesis protein CcmH/NrfG